MSERDLSIPEHDPVAEWEGGSTANSVPTAEPLRGGVSGWVGSRIEAAVARVVQGFSRRSPTGEGLIDGMICDSGDPDPPPESVRTLTCPTLMEGDEGRRGLAERTLKFAEAIGRSD